jgi:hypothetical protein
MMIPRIIAAGCNQSSPNPASTPRNKLPASDPPPSVKALCSQPGPESRM